MTDRLTDAELLALGNWAVGERMRVGLMVSTLIAEVREHRAARTLTDREQGMVEHYRRPDVRGPAILLAIIDRITKETDRA